MSRARPAQGSGDVQKADCNRMADIGSSARGPRFGDVMVTVVEAINNKRLHSGRIGMELILAACAPGVKEVNIR